MAPGLSRIVYNTNLRSGVIWALYHVQIAHRKTCIFGFILKSRLSVRTMALKYPKTVFESHIFEIQENQRFSGPKVPSFERIIEISE